MAMRLLILSLTCVAACNMPTYPNRYAPAETVTVDGMRFRVFHTLSEAEAYRLNPMWRPKYEVVSRAGISAIETASGCRVNPAKVQGDAAKIAAELVC